MENANPTIRPVSELPTRRPKTAPKGYVPGSIIFSAMPKTDYNADPFDIPSSPSSSSAASSSDDNEVEPIDEQEIYDLIAPITDPEHPLSLGSLGVVNLPDISIKPLGKSLQVVTVEITPTITHCSLATLIGLGVRVRLEQALPPRFRVDVRCKEGSHSTGDQVNKQLGDKERVREVLVYPLLPNILTFSGCCGPREPTA